MEDYTYDPEWGAYFTGDPSVEENWTYEPPGVESNQDWWNLEVQDDGGYMGYSPGEAADPNGADFSYPGPGYPGVPSQEQQDQAIYDYMDQWGMGPDTAEAWQGEGGEQYTKDYEGNVFDAAGNWVGNDQPQGIGEDYLGGIFPGGRFAGAEEEAAGPPALTQPGGPPAKPPPGTKAGGKTFVVGLGWADDNARVYMQGREMSAREAADLQHEQSVEANRKSVAGQETIRLQKAEEFKTVQERLREAELLKAQGVARGQDISARTAQQAAQARYQESVMRASETGEGNELQAAVAREKIQAEKDMQSTDLAAKREAAERAQRLALVQTLMAAARGPNGPANYRMALELLKGMGLDPTALGIGAGQGAAAVNPMGIPPAEWDNMSDSAKQLILDAWAAQGGEPADFSRSINQQRPGVGVGGQPSAARSVVPRFAGVAGA